MSIPPLGRPSHIRSDRSPESLAVLGRPILVDVNAAFPSDRGITSPSKAIYRFLLCSPSNTISAFSHQNTLQMHHFFFLLLSTSTITYGLSVPLINKRTDPTLMSGNGLTRTHTVTLTRRTNPTFEDGDFGDDWDGVSKKDVLESAFDDVYTLALSAVNQFDDRIFNNWFPPKDRDSVKAVFSAIVKNEVRNAGTALN